jgi:hypothetical protein
LLSRSGVKIEIRPPDGDGPGSGAETPLDMVEVLEGGDEFIEALSMRLNEIVRKPSGRFVISYMPGTPGAKKPPLVQ